MPRMWSALAGLGILVRSWGDDYVVYSELTGQTHLVGPLAAMVLRLLQEWPSGSSELAERVAEALKLEEDDKLLTTVEQTLADFERLGLAEQTRF